MILELAKESTDEHIEREIQLGRLGYRSRVATELTGGDAMTVVLTVLKEGAEIQKYREPDPVTFRSRSARSGLTGTRVVTKKQEILAIAGQEV